MQYPVPAYIDPEDPESERFVWRLANIGPDHPRFRHLPVVVGWADGSIEAVRGNDDLAHLPVDHPERQRLFTRDGVGKKHFVVRNRLGYIRLVRCGPGTPVGFIELHLYSAPLGLSESIGAARSMAELTAAVDAEAVRLRDLAADGWEVFRYPASGVQILVDTRRPDEDLTEADLP
jgi:hypothetical protein